MRRPASPKVQDQLLKVQELVVRFIDTQLLAASVASHSVVLIGESVSAVVGVQHQDDSGPTCVLIAAASLSVVNSSDFGGTGTADAIRIGNVQLAANDRFEVQYIVKD